MDSESNSIQNQKKILQKAAKDKGYTDTIFFVDDGITGTTMKRPGFQKMITAIEAGYISAVNIMNEYYAKDISKKRRIVNKMKGNAGVPLSPPPYGYMKNPDDPRFWVIDPEAAEVVRRIYRMALEGNGPL